ncbi:DUF2326 domain-containing protein [Aeromicrobium alkaliterrae]|uniref:DUF2326 domain-containing protein n=1 Tax=Aeromicrobium alkaliterrae TaxID=302168 RepID=A0ABN2KE98_9ACTN
MRLRRLYSDQPEFDEIVFNDGVSAVFAEIRIPSNRDLDTHNLGKTTVGELIDFCLLRGKHDKFFLFKHQARFADFTFRLELALDDDTFLTISRPVSPGSRIDFLKADTSTGPEEISRLDQWDHTNVSFDRAKKLLDGWLGFTALAPWGYRKLAGYLVRSQSDYQDVFQLNKFSGKHVDWKPFVAHLLGMSSQPVIALYEKREELAAADSRLQTLTQEWGGDDVDASLLDGLIAVKRREVAVSAEALESFNFDIEDRDVVVEVVEVVEAEIAQLNEERYELLQILERLSESLADEQIVFRTKDAAKLFAEAGVVFGEQLTRNFDQLVEFNRKITQERRGEIESQLAAGQARLEAIEIALPALNARRAESLEFLRESEALEKYKLLGRDLATLRADLQILEARRTAAGRLLELRREQRELVEETGRIQTAVENEIEEISKDDTSRFGQIRQYFTEIVHEVLGQNAILAIKVNGSGGLDFVAEFVGDGGKATSGDKGTSYKKLLCIAFDLAFLRAYLNESFPRFVYHDGALEQLEPRKRQKLISVLREYEGHGLQPIISLLDSDLPEPLDANSGTMKSSEIVKILHDEGESGRLFTMAPW